MRNMRDYTGSQVLFNDLSNSMKIVIYPLSVIHKKYYIIFTVFGILYSYFIKKMMSPFECPICLERYNVDLCIPTSFSCGHSCCISHTKQNFENCPICRIQIKINFKFIPNYDLRDGAVIHFKTLEELERLKEKINVLEAKLEIEKNRNLSSTSTKITSNSMFSKNDVDSVIELMNLLQISKEDSQYLILHNGTINHAIDYYYNKYQSEIELRDNNFKSVPIETKPKIKLKSTKFDEFSDFEDLFPIPINNTNRNNNEINSSTPLNDSYFINDPFAESISQKQPFILSSESNKNSSNIKQNSNTKDNFQSFSNFEELYTNPFDLFEDSTVPLTTSETLR